MLIAAALMLLWQSPTLPDAPVAQGVHPWGLTASFSEKYDLRKLQTDAIPQIAVEYRPIQPLRLNVALSRSTNSGDFSIAAGIYYKVLQWGKRR